MKRRLIYVAVVAVTTVSTALIVAGGRATAANPTGPNRSFARSVSPDATNVCVNTFTSGSGPSAQSFCVTANGNVGQLSWQGIEQIRLGNFTEGYMLCLGGVVKAYDFEDFGETGFQAPTVTQPGGPGTLPLTIKRLTTDGMFSVGQTFSMSAGYVTVSNSVTNVSGATAHNVRYIRLADFDDPTTFIEEFSRSVDAVTAHVENSTGTMMTTSSFSVTHAVYALSTVPTGTCAPVSDTTPESADGVAAQSFDFPTIGNAASKKVTTIYRRY